MKELNREELKSLNGGRWVLRYRAYRLKGSHEVRYRAYDVWVEDEPTKK